MPRPIVFDFKQDVPVTVRRPFVGGGRHFVPGDAYDWRRLKIDRRKVEKLFQTGHLMHMQEEAPVVAEAPVVEETTDEVVVEPTTEVLSDDLDAVDSMAELREIAKVEGAPLRLSKDDQRTAIREHRAGGGQ